MNGKVRILSTFLLILCSLMATPAKAGIGEGVWIPSEEEIQRVQLWSLKQASLTSSDQIYDQAVSFAKRSQSNQTIINEIIHILEERAKNNDPYSLYFATALGQMYYEGTLVEKDDEKAKVYLKEASSKDPLYGKPYNLLQKILFGDKPIQKGFLNTTNIEHYNEDVKNLLFSINREFWYLPSAVILGTISLIVGHAVYTVGYPIGTYLWSQYIRRH